MRFLAVFILLVGCGPRSKKAVVEPAVNVSGDLPQGIEPMAISPGPEKKDVKAERASDRHAPGGQFETSDGDLIRLDARYAKQGLVVVFYQGAWCRHCREQLSEFQGILVRLRELEYDVVAISTDSLEESAKLKKRLGLDFDLLVDQTGISSANWGVFNSATETVRSGVFIVAPGGELKFHQLSEDPVNRPTPEKILDAVGRLSTVGSFAVRRGASLFALR